ncbi:hypothetical protein BT67DRAFT_216172 [Trichocladium antarcticum]|uniref:Uncharacterized protein n=1 Tax=Trichocladium antarcticum TaxID=1450529 RepID=A0AAN6UD99_9PEZI|nr:hypothetical protein BT67DRAFT_216172 [Trichocladium antarcticum]
MQDRGERSCMYMYTHPAQSQVPACLVLRWGWNREIAPGPCPCLPACGPAHRPPAHRPPGPLQLALCRASRPPLTDKGNKRTFPSLHRVHRTCVHLTPPELHHRQRRTPLTATSNTALGLGGIPQRRRLGVLGARRITSVGRAVGTRPLCTPCILTADGQISPAAGKSNDFQPPAADKHTYVSRVSARSGCSSLPLHHRSWNLSIAPADRPSAHLT